MKLMKTLLATVGLATAAWMAPAAAQDKGAVGISMPTKSSARWISDGASMVKELEAKGYKADLQYADDDIPNQLAQIENMVTKGAKVLVIASIDGTGPIFAGLGSLSSDDWQDQIFTPTPGSLALLGIGGLVATRRRRA